MNKDIIKQKIKKIIADNKGILLFFVAMFGANMLWKLLISGSEDTATIILLGRYDLSPVFDAISEQVARVTYFFVRIFDNSVVLTNGNVLGIAGGRAVQVVWSCSGVKQMFIFLVIMLFASGSWKNKLWFVPMGLIACYFINIFRTTALTLMINYNYELFQLMHHYILKYLYYALIFLIWVAWEECLKNIKPNNKKNV